MKIAGARAWPVRLEFARPVRTSAGSFAARDSVLFALTDDEGRTGCGEAAPWPGFGTGTFDESMSALEDACRLIGGSQVEPGDWPPEIALRLRSASAARAAFQGALWDLAARRAGVPLADLLAQRVLSIPVARLHSVATHALLVAADPAELREEAARARDAGFRAAKIKLGGGPLADDVARAKAARDGLGDGPRLRGDANGAWTEAQAAVALDALAPFEFDYVEQPLAAGDLDAFLGLRERSPVRLALDESVATEDGALRAIAAGAASVFVLKPATLGGSARALEIAAMVRQSGGEAVFSHTFESAVGALHALHCAAAAGDTEGVHGLRTAGLYRNDVAASIDCVRGAIAVPELPGLGVTP